MGFSLFGNHITSAKLTRYTEHDPLISQKITYFGVQSVSIDIIGFCFRDKIVFDLKNWKLVKEVALRVDVRLVPQRSEPPSK